MKQCSLPVISTMTCSNSRTWVRYVNRPSCAQVYEVTQSPERFGTC